MTFEELAEFRKDLKSLLRKYRTLHDDLEIVKRVLELTPDEGPPYPLQFLIFFLHASRLSEKLNHNHSNSDYRQPN